MSLIFWALLFSILGRIQKLELGGFIRKSLLSKLFFLLRFRKKDWRPSEGFRKITLFYGFCSIMFMLSAVYFFAKELKTSAGTPAESRNLNDVCAILIFDNHDLWHFLSAAGLFYLFMFILTLEDYNRHIPRYKIPVF